ARPECPNPALPDLPERPPSGRLLGEKGRWREPDRYAARRPIAKRLPMKVGARRRSVLDGALLPRNRCRMLWPGERPRVLPPGFIEPCLPTTAKKPPDGPEWIHEIKHDGYRLLSRRRERGPRLYTRRGFDWTHRFPCIAATLMALRVRSCAIDGEAVWCGPDG